MSDSHETWALTQVVLYFSVEQSATINSGSNPLFGGMRAGVSPPFNEPRKETIYARVKYNQRQDESSSISLANLSISEGMVRIKIHEDVLEKVKTASKIEIHNE
jgi:hypothetical protein